MRDADRASMKPMSRRSSDLTGSAPGLARSAASADRCNARCRIWAGQSAALAKAEPAGDLVRQIWNEVRSPSSHSPGATRAAALHDARRAQRSRHVDWHCHFAFPQCMRTRKIARLRRRSESPLMAPRHAAKVSLDRDRWSEPCKLKR